MISSSGGIAHSDHSARRALKANMIATMPPSVSTSMNRVSEPALNISLIASISVVIRLTSRPTGVRSKNDIGSRSTCRNSASRKSDRLYCATIMVR